MPSIIRSDQGARALKYDNVDAADTIADRPTARTKFMGAATKGYDGLREKRFHHAHVDGKKQFNGRDHRRQQMSGGLTHIVTVETSGRMRS